MDILKGFIKNLIRVQPWPQHDFVLPRFQSHRGFHQDGLQENTLRSLQRARELGARMCEFDVQLSKDKIPILFHDFDLRKQTGESHQISSLNLKDLRNRFSVTTLEEVFRAGDVPSFLNIELKTREIEDPLARIVAKLVKKYSAENRILFSSFNPFALYSIAQYLPQTPRALLVTNAESDENPWYLRKMLFAPFLQIHMLNLDQEMLDDESLKDWTRQGIPVAAWTVNEPEKVKSLLKKGVRSVISDLDPRLFFDLNSSQEKNENL